MRGVSCFNYSQIRAWALLLPIAFLWGSLSHAAVFLSDPAVDRFNVRVGTQTFGVKYQFTTNTTLVETAQAITNLGSDIIKFYAGKGTSGQYGFALGPGITSLRLLARNDPSYRRVFDLPFRHAFLWTYPFVATGDAWWKDGYSAFEAQQEYTEVYDFTRYLLTNYNNSGRKFYFGHWEGDWYLLNNYDTSANPSATAIQGMINWLNNRQKAIDDANRDVAHANVWVYQYTEVNRVRDAMLNSSTNNHRLVNAVLPYVTNVDFVSWSSYDGQDLGAADLHATLDYIDANLPEGKALAIAGKRVFIGEYGWGGSLSSEAQEPPTRAYMQKLLAWGTPFILFWEMYNNEPGKQYWLVDTNGLKTPCWHLHQRFINQSKLRVARFKEANGRLPDDAEFTSLVHYLLNQPLSPPVSMVVSNLDITALTTNSATVRGALAPRIYGMEAPAVRVFYGRTDGGTNRAAWEKSAAAGLATNFNAGRIFTTLTNLEPGTNWFFRFYATNSAGETWAPGSSQFSTDLLKTSNLATPISWTLVQQMPALVGDAFVVRVSIDATAHYFCLR